MEVLAIYMEDGKQMKRLVWIDWMKTIAMYLIIAGHCVVPGNKYIYVFSVPCFFIISGFLSKRENDSWAFWNKMWWNLVLPSILLFMTDMVWRSVMLKLAGSFSFDFLWGRCFNALLGFHGLQFAEGGIGVLWFVYTLILCKVILHYLPSKHEKVALLLLNIIFLTGTVVLHVFSINMYNAYTNVLIAMPFFTLGYLMRPYKELLSAIKCPWLFAFIFVGSVLVWLCGTYNDLVSLFNCCYGSSLALCLIGGVLGTAIVFAVSRFLQSFCTEFANVVGETVREL